MTTRIRSAAHRLAAVGAAVAFAVSSPVAAQAAVVPSAAMQVAAPSRFEWVLWSAADAPPEQHAAARRAGFTAVQLPRGGDPAPLLAADLGYYLDQPIGKGVLELRDQQWQPIREAYERSRDPAVLLRPGCFAVPGRLAELAAAVASEVQRVAGPGLRFVALADEASATRHDAPLDTCHCPHCLQGFRDFAAQRFARIERYNAAMGTQAEDFAAVRPLSTDQVRRRELSDTVLPKNLQPFLLQRQFVAAQYAEAIGTLAAAARRAAPTVPVGLTGIPVPAAFGGNEPARLRDSLSLLEPYPGGGNAELWRSLQLPGAHRYATLFVPAKQPPGGVQLPLLGLLRARCAELALYGHAGAVVWNDAAVFTADGGSGEPRLSPFGSALREAMREHAAVLDACAGAVLVPSSCWVLESQESVAAWWMLDSAQDGMTWLRRFASHEGKHSSSQAARLGWSRLLQDLGLQPHFVTDQQLPERLLQERPRCLVLPATLSISDRLAAAIRNYVFAGGTVLADHSTGLYDENLVLRDSGALDGLFGIEERSLRWEDLLLREGRLAAPLGKVLPLVERGLRGKLGQRRRDGDAFLEHRLGRGRAVYLNAPVALYPATRLVETQVELALELRRRIRTVLQNAGIEPPCDVRGSGLPTCLERVPLRLVDGRQVLAIRLHALDEPFVLQQLAAKPHWPVTVEFPRERRLRLLGGEELGTGSQFALQLPTFGALFLEDLRR